MVGHHQFSLRWKKPGRALRLTESIGKLARRTKHTALRARQRAGVRLDGILAASKGEHHAIP